MFNLFLAFFWGAALTFLVVAILLWRSKRKRFELPTPEMAGWRRCGSCQGLYPPMSSDAGLPDEFCCAECEIAVLEEKYGKAA